MLRKVFDIDYRRLAILLLPTMMRGKKMSAWLQSAVAPIAVIYSDFTAGRLNALYKLAHNSQVCYLRKALNDAFDPSIRRIRIEEGNRFKRFYIYTRAEKQARYMTAFLRQTEDYADTGVDFRIITPKGIGEGNYQMRALIDFYKLASKRYLIEKK